MSSTSESSRLRTALSRVVKELEDEETKAEFEELRGRKFTLGDLLQTIREAPAEERAALREILAEEGLPTTAEGEPPVPPAPPAEPPTPPAEEEPPGPAKRTRPGRKSGSAYDWDLDDDGQVVRSKVAVVYSGPDEPDEVEMLEPPEPEEEPGEDE